MRQVLLPAVLLAALLSGCSGAAPDKQVIADRCVRDGIKREACDCLALQSIQKFEKPALEAVVLGAQGEDQQADKAMAALTPDQSLRFRATLDGIVKACGASEYLAK